MKISVKEQAELRHILAHIIYAIRANADGHAAEAHYEVDQIEGLVFWDSDEDMTKMLEKMQYGKMQQEEEGEELQEKGKELQEEEVGSNAKDGT